MSSRRKGSRLQKTLSFRKKDKTEEKLHPPETPLVKSSSGGSVIRTASPTPLPSLGSAGSVPSISVPNPIYGVSRAKIESLWGGKYYLSAEKRAIFLRKRRGSRVLSPKTKRLLAKFEKNSFKVEVRYATTKLRKTVSEQFYYTWNISHTNEVVPHRHPPRIRRNTKNANSQGDQRPVSVMLRSGLLESASVNRITMHNSDMVFFSMQDMDKLGIDDDDDMDDDMNRPRSASQCCTRKRANSQIEIETKDGQAFVTSGTLEELVIHLFDPLEAINHLYIHTFFLTYRYLFATPKDLLIKLFEHFKTEGEDAALDKVKKMRIIQLLRKWIETPFFGFFDDEESKQELKQLVECCTEGPFKEWIADLLTEPVEEKTIFPITKAPRPIIPSSAEPTFSDLAPIEVARQLTLIDNKMFRKVKLCELTKLVWAKEHKNTLAPNIVALSSRFNQVSYWVATEILSCTHPSQRVEVLRRFIEIAENLVEMSNFNGAMQIFAALNMGPVQRIKSTWKDLPEKYKKKLRVIENLFSSAGNYSTYRQELEKRTPPFVPFQAVIFQGLTQCEEIPQTLENGRINFEKMNKLAKVLSDMEIARSVGYPFEEVPVIQSYLENLKCMSEVFLYKMAKECEEAAALKSRGSRASFYGTLGRRTMRDDIKKALEEMEEEEKEKEMEAKPTLKPDLKTSGETTIKRRHTLKFRKKESKKTISLEHFHESS